MKTRFHRRAQSGYTLVELVMSMTILSIIGMVSSKVTMESMRVYSRVVPALDADYHSDLALRLMKREIRDLLDTGSITTMSASTFAFKNSSDSAVSFVISGTELTLNGDLLATGVTLMTFSYSESDGSATTDAADLHLVEIDLTVQKGDEVLRTRAQIFPRNLGLSL